MKNIDKFKDDIKTLMFGLIDGKPKPCIEITNIFGGCNCRNCGFYKEPFNNNYINCEKLRLDWLAQEVQEEPEKPEIFLSKEEYYFLLVCGDGYIARDKNYDLWFYAEKPERVGNSWASETGQFPLNSSFFEFIKWEDEPYFLDTLLMLNVEW